MLQEPTDIMLGRNKMLFFSLTIFEQMCWHPLMNLDINLGTNAYKQTKNNHALVQYDLTTPFSVNIAYGPCRFEKCILEIQMEGSVSQNVDISPSFFFMKCRKNVPKVTRFLT